MSTPRDITLYSKTVRDSLGHDLFECRIEDAEGRTLGRRIFKWDAYFDFLGRTLKEKRTFSQVSSNLIPKGYIKGWFSDSNNYTVIWKADGEKRQFVLKGCGHYQIPFPDMVFKVKVSNGTMVSKACYVLIGSKLYQYPFGNVSSSGEICMGNINVKELSSLDEFAEEFFLGITNNDYWDKGSHITDDTLTQQEFVEKMHGKESIPAKYFIDRNMTLDELIEQTDKEHQSVQM